MQASKEDGFAGAPPLWEEEALAALWPRLTLCVVQPR